jgi:hypothetical protein
VTVERRVGRPRVLSDEFVARLRVLHEEGGLSFNRIARELNEARVPRAHAGKAWHCATVAKLIRTRARERG